MAENPDNSGSVRDERIVAANAAVTGERNAARAAGMFEAAMKAGSGEAAERLAVMAAAGVGRPVNWAEALDLLRRSAGMGWAPAEGQLKALGGEEPKALLKPPHLERVRDRPAIALISGLATKAMCEWIIARAEARVERAKIGDYSTGQGVPDPIRTGFAAGFGFADTNVVMVLTQERLARASGLALRQQEAPFVLSYEHGQEYKPHFDFFNPEIRSYARQLEVMGQRVATCLTWLNEDYEGGETAFLEIDWKHRGNTGDAMLFLNVTTPDRQPDLMTLHAGLPVTSGRKWLLSQWVRDRAQLLV